MNVKFIEFEGVFINPDNITHFGMGHNPFNDKTPYTIWVEFTCQQEFVKRFSSKEKRDKAFDELKKLIGVEK